MSKRLVWVIVVIVIVLVAGGIVLTQKNKNNTAANSNQQSSNTAPINSSQASVVYYDNGFTPNKIEVKKGTTITFRNSSTKQMWVASNPHPTHTDYPAFDEKASVAPSGTWSFTFDQIGTWGYHNHNNPSSGGTIVVTQ